MNKEFARKVGIWFLAASLFFAHLFFRSVAHADPGPSWKQVFAKSGECQISFPSVPELIEQSLKVANSEDHLKYEVYLAPFEEKGVFLLMIATYPQPIPSGHEVVGLEALLRGIISHHPDNTLEYAEVLDIGGKPAINFLVQSGTSYFRGHALMAGNKLYLIAMEGYKGTLEEKIFSRFVKSFKLVNQAPAAK